VKTNDYWPVYFALTEQIKKRFEEEGISIPFPQRDVHLYQHDADYSVIRDGGAIDRRRHGAPSEYLVNASS
jgi:small-conductance mechanosensitive channel